MDYEKAYKEAFERAKQVHASSVDENKKSAEYIFPQLKESEDERIRKELIDAVQGLWDDDALPMPLSVKRKNEWLAWLEKQGKSKSALEAANEPADKIEPRFKVGDWVVANYSRKISQVVAVSEDGYGYQLDDGLCFGVSWCDIFHLWCIKDARDGDILASDSSVFIFQKEYIAGKPTAYCGIVEGNFCQGSGGCWTNEQCHPATKEQWDALRSKMKEAGYEWDSEKKELKEIAAPKPEAGDDEEDDKEADDKAENWKLTLARQRLGK
ncbi:MAG: hypothetical protein IKO36_04850 [Bacteroidaceae bacterium]|nr:hypothetical protein [Bacteroidaceae bacterium]